MKPIISAVNFLCVNLSVHIVQLKNKKSLPENRYLLSFLFTNLRVVGKSYRSQSADLC